MKPANFILTFVKGVAMGAADVVPGVSGGTIALITGIYERFINAIKSVNISNLKLLLQGKFKRFWRNVDGTFLLALIAGIATSFLSLAKLMTYLITTSPILIWSFFFGLILASTVFIARDVKWHYKTILAFVLFTLLAFFLTSPENAPISANSEYWYICLCGSIAICAMILPGISGSFILVLLGQYFYIMKALTDFNWAVIGFFLLGAVVGLTTFSRLLSWLFKHYKMITLASLTGFMFGSLNKIWAWKETLSTFTDSHGVEHSLTEKNVLPLNYDGDPQLIAAIFITLLGFGLIFAIEYIAKKLQNKTSEIK